MFPEKVHHTVLQARGTLLAKSESCSSAFSKNSRILSSLPAVPASSMFLDFLSCQARITAEVRETVCEAAIRAFNVQAYVAWRRFPPTASSLCTSRLNVGEQPFDGQPLALQKQGLAEVHGSDFGFGAFDSYNPRREQVPPFAASLCFLSFGYRFPNVCAVRVLKSGILQVTSKMLS